MAHVAKYKGQALGNMCAHYDRWGGDFQKAAEREAVKKKVVDPELSPLNYNLAPHHDGGQVAFINARIKSLNTKRKPRKDAVRMCDCVLTMPQSLDREKQRAFFSAGYDFLSERYGAENVVSAFVHLDEPNAQPHMHFAWVPVTKDGRLSAKDVVTRGNLRTLHTDMQKYLEEQLGCPVEVLLDDEKQGEKMLSKLSQPDYEKAKAALESKNGELKSKSTELKDASDELDKKSAELERAQSKLAEVQSQIEQENDRLEGLQRERERTESRVALLESLSADCEAADSATIGRKGGLLSSLAARCNGLLRAIAQSLPEKVRAALLRPRWKAANDGSAITVHVPVEKQTQYVMQQEKTRQQLPNV